MKEPSHIAEILGAVVLIRVTDKSTRRLVRNLGGFRQLFPTRTWGINYEDEKRLASILVSLRDSGVPFSSGRQWPPSDVFEDLREKGLVAGKYKKIFWHGPGDYEFLEV